MESEKFGSEKEVSNRSFKHFLFFLYLHHNFLVRILLWVWVSEIILHRNNSRNWSRRQFGTKKGLGYIWFRSRNFAVLRLSHLTFSNLLYPFLIFTSQFLVRILVSVWVSVSVSSRSRDFCIFWMVSEPVSKKFGTDKSPGIGLGKI